MARERAGEEEHRGNQPKRRRTGHREAGSDEGGSQQQIERLGAAQQEARNESGKPYVVTVPPGSHPLNLLRRGAAIEDPPANLQLRDRNKAVTRGAAGATFLDGQDTMMFIRIVLHCQEFRNLSSE